MTESPSLLPCPFPECGATTTFLYQKHGFYQVACSDCGAAGSLANTEAAAVDAWNVVAGRPAWPWLDAEGQPVMVQDRVISKQGDEVVVVSLGAGGLLELASASSPAFVERSHFCRLIKRTPDLNLGDVHEHVDRAIARSTAQPPARPEPNTGPLIRKGPTDA